MEAVPHKQQSNYIMPFIGVSSPCGRLTEISEFPYKNPPSCEGGRREGGLDLLLFLQGDLHIEGAVAAADGHGAIGIVVIITVTVTVAVVAIAAIAIVALAVAIAAEGEAEAKAEGIGIVAVIAVVGGHHAGVVVAHDGQRHGIAGLEGIQIGRAHV